MIWIISGWLLGMLFASRYVVNWMDVKTSPDDLFVLGCVMTAMTCAVTWPLVLAYAWVLAPVGHLVQRAVPGGVGKWVKWFYTLDRQERKAILR